MSISTTTYDLPEATLARPVQGRNLSGSTLRDNLVPEPQLLVFLRHFG